MKSLFCTVTHYFHVDRRLPRIPMLMLPKVWGLPQSLMDQYISKDLDGSVMIGAGKNLQVSLYNYMKIQCEKNYNII